MKLYLVFAFDGYYPAGGWSDIITGKHSDGDTYEAVTTDKDFAIDVAQRRKLFRDDPYTAGEYAQVIELDTDTLKTTVVYDA